MCRSSERIAHCEVQCEISAEIGVKQRIFILSRIGGVYGFHAAVETEDKKSSSNLSPSPYENAIS